jgi:hypothetical protein
MEGDSRRLILKGHPNLPHRPAQADGLESNPAEKSAEG